MCRNDRAGAHTDVQHDRPQRVIRVADPQRDVALTGERETIRLELIVEYFLIDHDTVSCASKCQSALNWAPLSASKRDPFERLVLAVALAPSELAGVATTARARAGT